MRSRVQVKLRERNEALDASGKSQMTATASKNEQGRERRKWSLRKRFTSDDSDADTEDLAWVDDNRAFHFFLSHGGRQEDWTEEANRSARKELVRRWKDSAWAKVKATAKAGKHNDKDSGAVRTKGISWVGDSFTIGDSAFPSSVSSSSRNSTLFGATPSMRAESGSHAPTTTSKDTDQEHNASNGVANNLLSSGFPSPSSPTSAEYVSARENQSGFFALPHSSERMTHSQSSEQGDSEENSEGNRTSANSAQPLLASSRGDLDASRNITKYDESKLFPERESPLTVGNISHIYMHSSPETDTDAQASSSYSHSRPSVPHREDTADTVYFDALNEPESRIESVVADGKTEEPIRLGLKSALIAHGKAGNREKRRIRWKDRIKGKGKEKSVSFTENDEWTESPTQSTLDTDVSWKAQSQAGPSRLSGITEETNDQRDHDCGPVEVLMRQGSDLKFTSAGAAKLADDGPPPLPGGVVRRGMHNSCAFITTYVFMVERMWVRVAHTRQDVRYYDEQTSRVITDLRADRWKEFLVVWRKGKSADRLELYESHVSSYT